MLGSFGLQAESMISIQATSGAQNEDRCYGTVGLLSLHASDMETAGRQGYLM